MTDTHEPVPSPDHPRSLLDAVAVGLEQVGADGFYQWVNPALAAMLGVDAAALVGRPFLDFVHDDDREAHARLDADLLSGAVPSYRFDRRVTGRGGERRLRVEATVLRREGSPPVRVASVYDVTDERRVQEQSHKDRDEFLATLSHEIRTPLGALLNAIHLARDGNADDVSWGLDVAGRQVVLLRRILEDLLDSSRLRCDAPQPQPARSDAVGAPATTGGFSHVAPRRVLVVDDNHDLATATALLLSSEGHATTTANDGPSALTAAKATRPDLVLLDISLPGMDGYEVASALRSDPETAGARLIALSGYGHPSDVHRSLEAGFDGHLMKPVELAVLFATVAETPPRPAG